ncbi:MAG TPA: 3'-5' exonuclease [Candidatus Tumulicola sp.]|nr:3'-5' exonuclease [Candidatus Tumulicola sp.]
MRSERYAVVDVETTGFSPVNDRVVEIACVCVDGDRIVDRWATLVDPREPIPPRATEIHGITDAMVAGAPTADRAIARLRRVAAARTIVAHSARFDLSFLSGLKTRDAICTVRLARQLVPEAPDHKNQTLRRVLEIDRRFGENLGAHRALDDALVTAGVLIECRARFSRRYWGVSWRRFLRERALVAA